LEYHKLADFTIATSGAQPERSNPSRNTCPGTGVPILNADRPGLRLFADRAVKFSRLSVAPDEALEHVIRSHYSPANFGVRWGFR
jgi:hypothetical protein